jgi:hypothetical protein
MRRSTTENGCGLASVRTASSKLRSISATASARRCGGGSRCSNVWISARARSTSRVFSWTSPSPVVNVSTPSRPARAAFRRPPAWVRCHRNRNRGDRRLAGFGDHLEPRRVGTGVCRHPSLYLMTGLPGTPGRAVAGSAGRCGGAIWRGNLIGNAAFAQIEFVTDSPLEGAGFELPVPGPDRD